jgi:hypothetical protein
VIILRSEFLQAEVSQGDFQSLGNPISLTLSFFQFLDHTPYLQLLLASISVNLNHKGTIGSTVANLPQEAPSWIFLRKAQRPHMIWPLLPLWTHPPQAHSTLATLGSLLPPKSFALPVTQPGMLECHPQHINTHIHTHTQTSWNITQP